ncbi:MAG: hypothetical protein GEV11_01560 [Streptosporangiales bacterium]|nr:hypothetical protein [Streptosporangiales bacterium]
MCVVNSAHVGRAHTDPLSGVRSGFRFGHQSADGVTRAHPEWPVSAPSVCTWPQRVAARVQSTPGVADAATCPLTPTDESVHTARRFTASTLQSWDLTPLHDDATLIVSELVTNALRHALQTSAAPPCSSLPPPRGVSGSSPSPLTAGRPIQFQLHLLRHHRHLLCAVSDPVDTAPAQRGTDPFTPGGRGLHIIAALSQDWGWTMLGQGGKNVWALLFAE